MEKKQGKVITPYHTPQVFAMIPPLLFLYKSVLTSGTAYPFFLFIITSAKVNTQPPQQHRDYTAFCASPFIRGAAHPSPKRIRPLLPPIMTSISAIRLNLLHPVYSLNSSSTGSLSTVHSQNIVHEEGEHSGNNGEKGPQLGQTPHRLH